MRRETETRLHEALRGLADATSGAQAPLSLEASLRAEFRAAYPKRAHRPLVVWSSALAIAAMLVVAIAIGWDTGEKPVRSAVIRPPAPVEVPFAAAPLPTQLEPPRARPAALTPMPAAPEFEPLSPWYYNTSLPEARLGHIVRVEVSRQAARQFGLMLPGSGPEMVKADVWIGDDGITRAIRFVR
jgi:hypothetical protein